MSIIPTPEKIEELRKAPSQNPELRLLKSKTYLKYKDECGMCQECHEWTSVLEPCCNANVHLEGSTLVPSELWEAITNEVNDVSL